MKKEDDLNYLENGRQPRKKPQPKTIKSENNGCGMSKTSGQAAKQTDRKTKIIVNPQKTKLTNVQFCICLLHKALLTEILYI